MQCSHKQAAWCSHYTYFVLEALSSELAAKVWIFHLLLALFTETGEVILSLWEINSWSRSIEGRLWEKWLCYKITNDHIKQFLWMCWMFKKCIYHYKMIINKYTWRWIYTRNVCYNHADSKRISRGFLCHCANGPLYLTNNHAAGLLYGCSWSVLSCLCGAPIPQGHFCRAIMKVFVSTFRPVMKPQTGNFKLKRKKERQWEWSVKGGIGEKVRRGETKRARSVTVYMVNPWVSFTGSWEGLHLIRSSYKKTLEEALKSSGEDKRRRIFL